MSLQRKAAKIAQHRKKRQSRMPHGQAVDHPCQQQRRDQGRTPPTPPHTEAFPPLEADAIAAAVRMAVKHTAFMLTSCSLPSCLAFIELAVHRNGCHQLPVGADGGFAVLHKDHTAASAGSDTGGERSGTRPYPLRSPANLQTRYPRYFGPARRTDHPESERALGGQGFLPAPAAAPDRRKAAFRCCR